MFIICVLRGVSFAIVLHRHKDVTNKDKSDGSVLSYSPNLANLRHVLKKPVIVTMLSSAIHHQQDLSE